MHIKKLGDSSDTLVRGVLVVLLIVFAITGRLMPHPDNVAPIAAVALLGGALLPRRWALTLPVAAMVVSDLFIGLHSLILFTWGSFALIALGSHLWLKRIRPAGVVVASLAASTFFYVVTNFAVWAFGDMYAHSWAGLMQCYVNALPFFRNTLVGDLVFTVTLFGAYALAWRYALPYVRQRLVRQN